MEQVTKISSATIIFSYKFHSSPCKIGSVAGAAIRNFGSSSGVGRPYTANHLLICYFSNLGTGRRPLSRKKRGSQGERKEGGTEHLYSHFILGTSSLKLLHPFNRRSHRFSLRVPHHRVPLLSGCRMPQTVLQ